MTALERIAAKAKRVANVSITDAIRRTAEEICREIPRKRESSASLPDPTLPETSRVLQDIARAFRKVPKFLKFTDG